MRRILICLSMFSLGCAGAQATDEIQVYNAEIASVGQLTIQQHLNYVPSGIRNPDFPGAIPSNGSLNGTPEFAYGLTDWWEIGLYLPFSVQGDRFYSDAFKVRTLFVTPHAEQRNFFYGVNFEFSNTTPPFSQARFGLEVRPIIGVRNKDWEFIVNPIVDFSFGRYGDTELAPAARVARLFGSDFALGIEYYTDLGPVSHLPKFADQQHTVFAVTDFKAGVFDIDLGVGRGLTRGSDAWVVKGIIGYAFPTAGGSAVSAPLSNPFANRGAARPY